MHVPELMEAVHLVGLNEVYLVTRVDRNERVADLLPIIYSRQQVNSVPFLVIEAIPQCRPPVAELNDKQPEE